LRLSFSKYHGNGNDFIIIDNRQLAFPADNHLLVRALCDRNFGIGADGLMLLEEAPGVDFHMVYFNSDGKEGSMCGNGGRCIVRFAAVLGVIPGNAIFSGTDGLHEATVDENGLVHLKMKNVPFAERDGQAYRINTGSPHYIIFTSNIMETNVVQEGRKIRFSDLYKEEGINVNFVERGDGCIRIRTYERGVENETLACGTGSVAAALASVIDSPGKVNSVKVETRGGILKVDFRQTGPDSFSDIWLIGPAENVFEGTVDTDTFLK